MKPENAHPPRRTPKSGTRKAPGLALLGTVFALTLTSALAVPVDTELSLVIDISGSVSIAEYDLQMDGYADAFRDPAIQANILGGPNGAIAVNVILYDHAWHTTPLETWRLLDSVADIEDFADDLDLLPRPSSGGTLMQEGMNRSTALFAANGFESDNLIMDVSGDGPASFPAVPNARDAAEAAGIAVNAVAIEDSPGSTFNTDTYIDWVVTPGGFVLTAEGFETFEEVILRKLLVETDPPPGEGPDCVVGVRRVLCPDQVDEPYSLDLNLTNNAATSAVYAWLTPCLTGDLPAGAITLQPDPASVFQLPAPIPTGGSAPLNITLPYNPSLSGATVCFRLTLLDHTGGRCCTTKICVELPRCDCAELLDSQIQCELQADGTIKYTLNLTIRNRTDLSSTPFTMAHANFLPPGGFAPASVPITPPVPPGGTGTVTTCYFGAPGELCFDLALHDDQIEDCCTLEGVCLTLPQCGEPCQPDVCKITKITACCPSTGTARIVYTICNNCNVPRTYNWSAAGFSVPGCDDILTSADFSPSSGVIGPVAPGACASVTISVRCDALQPAHCAGYQVCSWPNAQVARTCCEGIVRRPPPGQLVVKQANPGPVLIDRDPTAVSFLVENPGTAAASAILLFADEASSLGFAQGQAGVREFSTRVSVPAGAQELVTVDVFQLARGATVPRFAEVSVWVSGEGEVLPGLPSLQLPMQLELARAPLPGFAPRKIGLQMISVATVPTPRVILRFPTEEGHTYQIQHSRNLLHWSDTTCTVAGVEVDEKGQFQGTGREVVCVVPCHTSYSQSYYRVITLP